MLRQLGCAYFVLVCTWHFDAVPAEDLIYACVFVHAVPVGFLLWSVKRGQSAAGVQYSCRLAGLGPLELTGAPTEIRTQDLADFIDNRGLTTILISLDYIIFSVSREGVLRTFVLLPCGIVSEPFPGSIAFALGDPLIGC